MSRIVVDADGLIKLGKAKVLALLVEEYQVLIPGAVYEEAVTKGKQELYEDAFELEATLGGSRVRIFEAEHEREPGSAMEETPLLGPGERAALRLYREEEADAVLSDDRVFLRFLDENSVPYLTPAGVVVGLVESGRLDPREGLAALERLREHVRDSVYREARRELERRKGDDGQ
jgi:predicted nucleic acid-binding protein